MKDMVCVNCGITMEDDEMIYPDLPVCIACGEFSPFNILMEYGARVSFGANVCAECGAECDWFVDVTPTRENRDEHLIFCEDCSRVSLYHLYPIVAHRYGSKAASILFAAKGAVESEYRDGEPDVGTYQLLADHFVYDADLPGTQQSRSRFFRKYIREHTKNFQGIYSMYSRF